MADILIRGMEMPKSCFDCIFENRFFGKIGCNNLPGMFANELHAIAYTTERNPFCPLVPIPEGHGELIDKQAFIADIAGFIECMSNVGVLVDGETLWGKLLDALANAKTIVPAEGGKGNADPAD